MPNDWEYEEPEAEPWEAEPWESEPWEAAEPDESDDESDDGDAEGDDFGEAVYWRRPLPPRPMPPRPFRGVQTAVVKTPAGNASIQLPSKVPTLAELTKVQKDLARTQQRLRKVSANMERARRASRSLSRADTRGARNGILLIALESVRDVLRDVGTYSLIRSIGT